MKASGNTVLITGGASGIWPHRARKPSNVHVRISKTLEGPNIRLARRISRKTSPRTLRSELPSLRCSVQELPQLRIRPTADHECSTGVRVFGQFYVVNYVSLAASSEAAISAIDRNSTSASSFDGKKPRRRQKPAASSSMALTMSARPPISAAPFTLRARA